MHLYAFMWCIYLLCICLQNKRNPAIFVLVFNTPTHSAFLCFLFVSTFPQPKYQPYNTNFIPAGLILVRCAHERCCSVQSVKKCMKKGENHVSEKNFDISYSYFRCRTMWTCVHSLKKIATSPSFAQFWN